jgi:hypothetical protein
MPVQALKNFLEWGAVRQPTSGSGVPRTRVDGCKLLELRQLQRPPWDRRVLVHLRWPTAGLRPLAARPRRGNWKRGTGYGVARFVYMYVGR